MSRYQSVIISQKRKLSLKAGFFIVDLEPIRLFDDVKNSSAKIVGTDVFSLWHIIIYP